MAEHLEQRGGFEEHRFADSIRDQAVKLTASLVMSPQMTATDLRLLLGLEERQSDQPLRDMLLFDPSSGLARTTRCLGVRELMDEEWLISDVFECSRRFGCIRWNAASCRLGWMI